MPLLLVFAIRLPSSPHCQYLAVLFFSSYFLLFWDFIQFSLLFVFFFLLFVTSYSPTFIITIVVISYYCYISIHCEIHLRRFILQYRVSSCIIHAHTYIGAYHIVFLCLFNRAYIEWKGEHPPSWTKAWRTWVKPVQSRWRYVWQSPVACVYRLIMHYGYTFMSHSCFYA